MPRILLAALALACVCSPALAIGYDPAIVRLQPDRFFDWMFWALAAAGMAFALFLGSIALDRRSPWLERVVFGVLFLVTAGVSTGAFAQTAATVAQPATDTAVVTVPLGTWIASYAQAVVEIVTALVMTAVTWGLRRLPASIGAVLKGVVTHAMVERAVQFGVNTVAGAVKDKALSVPVGSAVLANALNYVVQNAPGFIVKWMGGPNAIRDHIIAALPMEDGASLAHATPTALGATTADPVKALGA